MADLKTEASSLVGGGSKMSHVSDHLTGPLKDFKAASHDLSSFGALGSLLGATSQIREGMDELSSIIDALGAEWDAEATGMDTVGKVLDAVDRFLKQQATKLPESTW